MALRMNHSYHKLFPNNCAVIEQNGDDEEVGTCCFYAPDGNCPRHGVWIDLVYNPVEEPAEKDIDYLGRKPFNLCEYGNCKLEKTCVHYCTKHHIEICLHGVRL